MEFILFFLLVAVLVYQEWKISQLKMRVSLVETRYHNINIALIKLLNAAQRAKTSKE